MPPSTIEKVSSDDSSEASRPVTPSQKKRPNLEPEKETVHPENETVRDSFLQDPLRLLREASSVLDRVSKPGLIDDIRD